MTDEYFLELLRKKHHIMACRQMIQKIMHAHTGTIPKSINRSWGHSEKFHQAIAENHGGQPLTLAISPTLESDRLTTSRKDQQEESTSRRSNQGLAESASCDEAMPAPGASET